MRLSDAARHCIPKFPVFLAVAAVCMAGAGQAIAQTTLPGVVIRETVEPGKIRGTVYDSLLGRVIIGASVQLQGRAKPDTTDRFGRFSFDDVPAGKNVVTFSTAELDSLGFGVMGMEVRVGQKQDTTITLATPSLNTLWKQRCSGRAPMSNDSGFVWGTVRSASDLAPMVAASTVLRWYDLDEKMDLKELVKNQLHEVRTEDAGVYFACGVPTELNVTAQSATQSEASGIVEFAIGKRRVLRLDMLVSDEMVVVDSAAAKSPSVSQNTSSDPLTGTATINGRVLDEQGRAMSNALVSIAEAQAVARTSKDGRFTLQSLPAGTHMLEVRRVGAAMQTRIVALQPNQSVLVTMIADRANLLATYNVRASLTKGRQRAEYERRRDQGKGMFLEGKLLTERKYLADVFRSLKNGRVMERNDGTFRIVVDGGSFDRTCSPLIFLNGLPSNMSIVSRLRPDYLRAIEIYTPFYNVPREYDQTNKAFICGVMLVWTRDAAW